MKSVWPRSFPCHRIMARGVIWPYVSGFMSFYDTRWRRARHKEDAGSPDLGLKRFSPKAFLSLLQAAAWMVVAVSNFVYSQ